MFPELEKALRKHFAPYDKNDENAQLFATMLNDLTEETQEKITHGMPETQALSESLATLDELDTFLKAIHSKTDSSGVSGSQFNRFYDRFFATKLANSLSIDVSQVNQLIVNYQTATIVLSETDQANLEIREYLNHDRQSLYAKQQLDGDKIKIQQTARGGAFAFMRIRVEIKIPKTFTGFVYLNNKRGSVILEDLTGQYIMDCNTVNGVIVARNLNLSQIHVQTKAGTIKGAFLTAEQLVLNSNSGSIQIIHSQAVGKTGMISTKATSGKILLEHLQANEINAESRSGSIMASYLTTDHLNLLGHAGAINGQQLFGAGQCYTTSGSIKLLFKQVSGNLTAIPKVVRFKLDFHLIVSIHLKLQPQVEASCCLMIPSSIQPVIVNKNLVNTAPAPLSTYSLKQPVALFESNNSSIISYNSKFNPNKNSSNIVASMTMLLLFFN